MSRIQAFFTTKMSEKSPAIADIQAKLSQLNIFLDRYKPPFRTPVLDFRDANGADIAKLRQESTQLRKLYFCQPCV